MRISITLFLLSTLIVFEISGQILSWKDVYKLKSRQITFIPDSTIYKDSVDLNPIIGQFNHTVTIFLYGLEQSYRFDIASSIADTLGFVTAFTYEIASVKPTRDEKRMFPKFKIEEKEEWRLKSKVTPLDDIIVQSILAIIDSVNFESLPSSDTMSRDLSFFQVDGHGFAFTIENASSSIDYSVNSLYLNKHEKLANLKPIEPILIDYVKKKEDLKVEYVYNYCYNSGSILWICK